MRNVLVNTLVTWSQANWVIMRISKGRFGLFYGKANMLLRTFSQGSYHVKLQLFSSYCGRLYTCHLWCNYTVKQYREIQAAYDNVFRRLMGYEKFCSASGMFVENRSDTFDTRIYGFYQRVIVSENSLVKCVVNSSAWLSSKLYANWNKCLFVSQIVLECISCLYFACTLLFSNCLLLVLGVVTCHEVLQWHKKLYLIPSLSFFNPCICIYVFSIAFSLSMGYLLDTMLYL